MIIGWTAALALRDLYIPAQISGLEVVIVSAAVTFGALLPDIDSDESVIRNATRTSRSDGCLGLLASWLVHIFGGHRALTHTLLAWVLLSFMAAVSSLPNTAAIAFSIGYLSHLLADAVTVSGVPALWPIYRERICLLPKFIAIRTGSPAEYVVTVLACAVLLVNLWKHL